MEETKKHVLQGEEVFGGVFGTVMPHIATFYVVTRKFVIVTDKDNIFSKVELLNRPDSLKPGMFSYLVEFCAIAREA